jgi:hypothetical protein
MTDIPTWLQRHMAALPHTTPLGLCGQSCETCGKDNCAYRSVATGEDLTTSELGGCEAHQMAAPSLLSPEPALPVAPGAWKYGCAA